MTIAAQILTHFWTWQFLKAILVASPKIVSTVAGWMLRRHFDRRIKAVGEALVECRTKISKLDVAALSLEQAMLLRAAFVIVSASTGGDVSLRRMLDRTFRTSSHQRDIRLIQSIRFPDDYKQRIARYGEILATEYDSTSIDELQSIEAEADEGARSLLTSLQRELFRLEDIQSTLERQRGSLSNVVDSVGTIAAVVGFVLTNY